MTLETGHQLQQGRYVIQELLGRGGMGTVYLAADRNLPGRLVAIKENADTGPATQRQFQHEAILLARLTHPNLPRVTDHFTEPSGHQYLVMDYVEGDDLRALLRGHKGPLPEDLVRDWLDQVLSALSYMHNWIDPTTRKQTPIIHRDIKPGNIKRTPNGRIVLVDFGVAKVDETTEGTIVGARAITPGYSPLEQYSGSTDARSDIYALGATLYILLTGERPPEAPAIAAGAPLPPPRQRNRLISRGLERVVLRAMALHAADRFQNLEELRAALPPRRNAEAAGAAAITPIAPHLTLTRPPARSQRRAYWSGIGALTLLTLVVAGLIAMPDGWLTRWRPGLTPLPTVQATTNGELMDTATLHTPGPLTLAGSPVANPVTNTVAVTQVAVVPPTLTVTLTASAALTAVLPITPTPTTTTPVGVVATATVPPTPTVLPSPTATPRPATATPTLPPPTATVTPLPPTATATPLPTATATVTPVPVAGDQRTNAVDGAIYRFVPAGPFPMGSTMEANEQPVHTVTLAAFWIMETEVTNAFYAQCVNADACTPPANATWQEPELANHPVTDVDWAQAVAYAIWAGGRLPTEAEWEKAARGTEEQLFPWAGESTDETRLNLLSTGAMPVGSFPAGASPFGLLDMAGNVEEWVADWYSPDYYATSPAEDPPGPATGLLRVVRGGSFNSNRGGVRTTARGRAQPDAHFPSIGFRVVLSAP